MELNFKQSLHSNVISTPFSVSCLEILKCHRAGYYIIITVLHARVQVLDFYLVASLPREASQELAGS